jgi:hypothetical protein
MQSTFHKMLRFGEVDPREYVRRSTVQSDWPGVLKEAVCRGVRKFGIGLNTWRRINAMYKELFKIHNTHPSVSEICL